MKAAVRSQYGPPEVLSLAEVQKPVPRDNEVLVRVHATTVNRTDCGILWGKPKMLRLFTGLSKPKTAIMGTDFAGQVEAIGKEVRTFRVGDRVMGFNGMVGCGSHSQYLTFPETKGIITMPASLDYEQAAACIEGAFYAASGVKALRPKAGQKALVSGATGAIGSAMVQVLKYYGVHITATCRREHEGLVRSLGADKIIDYTTEDFTKDPGKYDFVFDAVGKSTFAKCKPLLVPKGIYAPSDGMINLLYALTTRMTSGKKVVFAPPGDIREGLAFVKELVEKGSFRPVIDRTFRLEEIVEAYRYVASGQKVGNVVIRM